MPHPDASYAYRQSYDYGAEFEDVEDSSCPHCGSRDYRTTQSGSLECIWCKESSEYDDADHPPMY